MCPNLSYMRTTTARELRNNYSHVLTWVSQGEEVEVTSRGKIVARMVPAPTIKTRRVDWAQSAAWTRRVWSTVLTTGESAAIRAEGA